MVIMGETFFIFLLVLILLYMNLALRPVATASGFGDVKVMKCIDRERQALLDFKRGLVDGDGRLSSWGSTKEEEDDKRDCCTWKGVHCSNRTGHVLILDLHTTFDNFSDYQPLRGYNISSSLLELKHLSYLDLSDNDFSGSPLPEFIGYLSRLKYLNLADTSLSGTIPHQLGNLTNLRSLILGGNDCLHVTNLEWLSQIRLLKYLDLSVVNLTNAVDWQQAIKKLPLLKELHLRYCLLPLTTIPPSLDLLPTNSSSLSLSIIDLAASKLVASSIYHWLFNLNASLVSIDLSQNFLRGPIPDNFGNMLSLEDVDLSGNSLDGGIPKSFGNLSRLHSLDLFNDNLNEQLSQVFKNLSGAVENSLETLILHGNQLSGSLPDFTRFSSLKELDLGSNALNGSFPASFGQICSLIFLDLSYNQISGPLPDIAVFPLLKELRLSDNRLQGMLPKSIGQLSKLEILDASANSLEGIISEAHLSNLSNLKRLILSDNSLALDLSSDWTPPFQLDVIRLSNSSMGPHFPKWLRTQNNFIYLDISCVGISDTIPDWFWNLSPSFDYLNLSYNKISGIMPKSSLRLGHHVAIDLSSNCFNGPIPFLPANVMTMNLSKNKFLGSISSLCDSTMNYHTFLDLSDNLLSGELPDCWTNSEDLGILNLANNNFSGKIPSSIGSLRFLKTLHLRNNKFVGELPSSLQECTQLRILDLGENEFAGKIPTWIGTRLTNLIVLSFRLNDFYGSIPPNICHLDHIQILDLSRNNISGNLPWCFNNFTSLAQRNSSSEATEYHGFFEGAHWVDYMDDALVQWKGKEWEYKKTLGLLKSIDLSSNKLVGKIPQNVASLKGLLYLNLSRNHLTGTIIQRIGEMEMLECLDLSKNQLSGEIPTDFTRLHFLGVLDLSDNNLSGKIPPSTQLQSFNPSSYAGNRDLCGLPLPKCPGDEAAAQVPSDTGHGIDNNFEEDEDRFLTFGFYVSMVLGFILSFWAVFGTLLLKRSWQHAYFQFVNAIKDWIYVTTAVYVARLQRTLNELYVEAAYL